MPQLLISVRNLEEARLAAAAGADVIDVKNPARGSLGAADENELRRIVQELGPTLPLSAALGELLDTDGTAAAPDTSSLGGLSYAKFGLAGCDSRPGWRCLWRDQIARFPPGVAAAAVIYADQGSHAPPAHQVLSAAVSCGAHVVLVDTWNKQQGHLLMHWTIDDLACLSGQVRAEGLKLALAGSLTSPVIEQILPLRPDFIAVRGAACRGGRTGPLDPQRVRQLAARVHQQVAWAM